MPKFYSGKKILFIAISLMIGLISFSACSSNQDQANTENSMQETQQNTQSDDASQQQSQNEMQMRSQMQSQQQGQQQQMTPEQREALRKQMQQMQQQAPDVDVSDQELEKFAGAVQEVQEIQRSAQQEMMTAIKDEGLEPQRFNEIMSNKRGQGQSQTEITAEEEQKFQAATQELQNIQSSTQQKTVAAIQDEGFDPQRFQKILQAVRADQELQDRYRNLMQN